MHRSFERGTILCYVGGSVIDTVIRLGSGKHALYDHCAVAMGDGTAIQAQYGGPARIVDEIERWNVVTPLQYTGDVERFIAELKRQLGVPYDYLGLLNVPAWNIFRRCLFDPDLQRTRARFCSTLIADAARRDPAFPGRIAPGKPIHAVAPQDIFDHFSAR